ncbi:MAG: ABC transporter permease [Acidobacteriota bacterium]
MSFEFFVAKRYLVAKRKQAFISVITSISIFGITIGVTALIIAIGLITGFQEDIQSKILNSTSHILISDITGEGIENWEKIAKKIKEMDKKNRIISATPVIWGMSLLIGPARVSPATIKGLELDEEVKNSDWLRSLEKGRLPENENEILLGKEIGRNVGADVGSSVSILMPRPSLSPFGVMPKMKRFRVSGIFSTGLWEFDSTTLIFPLNSAEKFFLMKGKMHYIQLKLKNIFEAAEISDRLKDELEFKYFITTWMDLNRSLFSALKLEKTVLFLTISLIVFVASLNIIASLILTVIEKTKDIGVLLSMGTSPKMIRKIFFYQGAIIGLLGTFFGAVLGLLVCFIATKFQLIKVPVDIYQIPFVPFRIKIFDLSIIILISLLISFTSTLFPSKKASKVNPIEALRYE